MFVGRAPQWPSGPLRTQEETEAQRGQRLPDVTSAVSTGSRSSPLLFISWQTWIMSGPGDLGRLSLSPCTGDRPVPRQSGCPGTVTRGGGGLAAPEETGQESCKRGEPALSMQGAAEWRQRKGSRGGLGDDRGGKGWRQASLAPYFVLLMSSQHPTPATRVVPLVSHSPVPRAHPAPDLLPLPPCILTLAPLPHLSLVHGSPWLPDSPHSTPSSHSAPGPRASLPRSWLR